MSPRAPCRSTIAIFAASNFLGPLLLGRLFDTVGRKPMVTFSYLGSAAITAVLAVLFGSESLGLWGFMAVLLARSSSPRRARARPTSP